ncbi:MAG: glucuronate isomerase [Candidatus Pelagibacter sp. TMED142]|nr:MAG: glucuronate isomerase [Candidatus Pelagibacter sp. TMED142]
MSLLDNDRLFPSDSRGLSLARALFTSICDLPIISPHGHTDPTWFSKDEPFKNPTALFVTPDHYVFRMLFSQGVTLEELGISPTDNQEVEIDPRQVWRCFASHYYLFRGTPSRLWIDYSLEKVFGIEEVLSQKTADEIYDEINNSLRLPNFSPRALFDRFNIDVMATTEGALETLQAHREIANSSWNGRVITTYRPDILTDPDHPNFFESLQSFGKLTNCDPTTWQGYLDAHRSRRKFFREHGATATDHGHPTARTANLSLKEAETLFDDVVNGNSTAEQSELFRAQMLTEMAKMSIDDGMVMQIHAGSVRNHSSRVYQRFGSDKGFDIPAKADYVNYLRPLLEVVGHEPKLTVIVFTLDETTYSRELAPLAGVYPALKLGPPWWFFDSVEGMYRFRKMTTETAGFYNTVGFNDDTRAFCSIPARHDIARRVDCSFLASLITSGRLREDEAFELAQDLTFNLAKRTYRL